MTNNSKNLKDASFKKVMGAGNYTNLNDIDRAVNHIFIIFLFKYSRL